MLQISIAFIPISLKKNYISAQTTDEYYFFKSRERLKYEMMWIYYPNIISDFQYDKSKNPFINTKCLQNNTFMLLYSWIWYPLSRYANHDKTWYIEIQNCRHFIKRLCCHLIGRWGSLLPLEMKYLIDFLTWYFKTNRCKMISSKLTFGI